MGQGGGKGGKGRKAYQCLNKDCCLDSHVKAAGHSCSLEWLGLSILLAETHQTWHLLLCHNNLLPAKVSQIDVGWKVKESKGLN